MSRRTLLIAAVLAAGLGPAANGFADPVFDDQAIHPQLLPRGSLEYEYALGRKEKAGIPKPTAGARQIGASMEHCNGIAPLSQATREKCEIRARQAAPAYKAD